MNLHPITALLILVLAFFFYSSGQVFFFFTTLAIGFLLFVVSLSASGSAVVHNEHKTSSSLYPEKMEIKITGDEHKSDGSGQKDLAEGIAGTVDFTGKVIGKLFGSISEKKEEKK